MEAAAHVAIAAAWEGMDQSAPKHQPEGLGGEAGQWGMGCLEAFHVHLHCSVDMGQKDIQDPEGTSKTTVLYLHICFQCHCKYLL